MHRIDGAGHIGNLFVAEDPAINRPPTEVTAEILNAFQEEIAGVILWAGLALNKADNTQLRQALQAVFATIISPQFQGNPTAPTPNQFDADSSLSTTEFVQRALGNLRGFTAVGASATLNAAQIGTLIQVGNGTPAGQTLTLPQVSAIGVHGASYWIYNASSSVDITIACNPADSFVMGNGLSGSTTLVLKPGEFAIFDAQPPVLWNVLGTISAVQMKASLTQHGYQKLPSGLIMQWGYFTSSNAGPVSVTFPIAFPNECRATILTPTISGAAVMATIDQVPLTLATGFSGSVWNTSGGRVNACGTTYIAIGY